MSRTITTLFCALFSLQAAHAQDVHFNPFNATPFYINPAFTGMFDGKLRISSAYTNISNTVIVPYTSFCLSADMPVYVARNGNYVGAGIQMIKDWAGDGDLANFNGVASLAYHQLFGKMNSAHNCDLSVGIQGAYSQKMIDLSKLYYGNEFVNGPFYFPWYPYPYYPYRLGNTINSYSVNAGVSFSQSVGPKFNYTIGISANNLNQPTDAIEKQQNVQVGNALNYAVQFGANIVLANRLVLRPALLYQFGNNYNYGNRNIIFGTELQYAISRGAHSSFFKNVFLGVWYRSGDSYNFTAGAQFGKSFRLALGADYNWQSAGMNGLEMQLQYVVPRGASARKRAVPCNRF